ncbi:MAG TPA: phosphoadenylyl-sulfate reductase [Bryobacterales bacterium]|nr:phosphoadenylyl-sulfate reductase [Bryobacterales bacterium]
MGLASTPSITLPSVDASAEDVLSWGFSAFGPRIGICISLQATGMVIVDMASRLAGSDLKVFTIDTGRLPAETHELIGKVQTRYGFEIEVISPDDSEVDRMVSLHGPDLFRDSVSKRRMCCEIRKVRPLRRKLRELDAWVVGLRRGQSETRRDVRKVALDEQHGGIYKLSPLADWSNEEVWAYIRRHDVPYHDLYDEGYTSIGCAPCTRATTDGEHARAGRWWWETDSSKECGIHVSPSGVIKREFDVLLDEVLVRAG